MKNVINSFFIFFFIIATLSGLQAMDESQLGLKNYNNNPYKQETN